MGRIYGEGKTYENGLGQAQKRALILMTVGGRQESYGEYGANPPLASVLAPIQHGIFWFNGFLPLDPFIAWGPARISEEERKIYLRQLDERLRQLHRETPLTLPPLRDFPGFKDQKKRFMASITRRLDPDDNYRAAFPSVLRRIAELRRSGIVLSSYLGSEQNGSWRGFLVFRESEADHVLRQLKQLPLASYFNFDFNELEEERSE